MLQCRLHFARHCALIFETDINTLLVKVLGPSIIKRESADLYDQAYEKVKRWGRQWQHEILSALTQHVKGIQEQNNSFQYMGEAAIQEFFHQNMNIYSIKVVFHVLACDVDFDKIFTSPLCELYCTVYTNMCFYVWETRVRNKGGIRQEDEKALFEKFRLVAREREFNNVKISDVPRPPPKPVSKKRTKIGLLTPLSSSDQQFKVFGLPSGATFQMPLNLQQSQQNSNNNNIDIQVPSTQYSQGLNNSHQPLQAQMRHNQQYPQQRYERDQQF